MGKNPADQFYWQDFYRDLHEHPLEIVGAWILILCKLWYEPERGKGIKTLDEWAKILGKTNKKSLQILSKIQTKNIGNVSPKLEKCIKNMPKNVLIEVVSRRMVEREKQRKYDSIRNKDYYQRTKNNPNFSGNSADENKIIQQEIPDSSSYLLTSNIKKQLPTYQQPVDKPVDNSQTETQDEYAEHIDKLRDKLGLQYWRTGRDNVHAWIMYQVKRNIKAKAILYCLMRVDEERPDHPWAYCEGILKKYNDSELHKKDNIFNDIVEKMKRL